MMISGNWLGSGKFGLLPAPAGLPPLHGVFLRLHGDKEYIFRMNLIATKETRHVLLLTTVADNGMSN